MTTKKGFSLIEIMFVIAIIGMLMSVVLVNINASQVRARDSKRAINMQQIALALDMFYRQYGCLPITSGSTCRGAPGYSQYDAGGFDYSSQGGGFLTFLSDKGFMPSVPVDPLNNMTGDSTSGEYAYKYYCYTAADGSLRGPSLSYWNESQTWSSAQVFIISPVTYPATSEYTCS